MITATVDKNSIKIDHEELITSGSVKTNFIQFIFSEDWNGLTKTAIFQTKKVSIPVIVDGEDKVAIPWEAMAFPKEEIKFGVYGVRFDDESTESVDEEIVLPTIWGSLGKVVEGVLVESPPITDPTKDAYLQLLDYIKNLQPGGGETTAGIPYVDQLVAPPDTYSAHDVETLIGKSLYYLTWSGDPMKIAGELEVGKEFTAYFLYDGEQLNPALNFYGVFVCDEYDPVSTERIKATLKNATLIGNRTESLNSFLTFFKLDAIPDLNVTTSIPFKSAVGVLPQWMNTAHRGLMTVGNELYLIDFRLEWLDHDNEAFQIKFAAIYPISNSGSDGTNGVTFTPFVSSEGVISWTNDGNLPNPEPVNIKGPDGENGVGVPVGGAAGQILSKKTAADYDTQWIDAPQGGGGTDLTGGDGVTIKNSVINIDTPVRSILTEAEFNALPESERNRGLYFLEKETTEGGGSFGGSYEEVYSTEEVRIGTWIDRKPLYRKVLRSITNLNSYDYGLLSQWDIDTLCKVSGYVRNTATVSTSKQSQFFIGLDNVNSSGSSIGLVSAVIKGSEDARLLRISVTGTVTGTAGFEYVIILEYTKTTDEPEVTS